MVSVVTISIFFFYRLLVSIIHPVLEIYSFICSILTPKTKENCCELLRILHRQNILPTDLTRPKVNFIFIHKAFTSTEILNSPYWSLYGIDESHAYFVKLPKSIEFYNARNAPFLYLTQFDEATELARMTLEEACQFGHKIGKPAGPVVYFSNTARSGSTLLCQMLQAAEEWVVLGEPDIFTLLPILYYENKLPQPLYDSLIKASFNIMCKNQQPHQTYVLKTQSNGTRLLPDIIRLLPEVKQFFSWRRNASKCVNSISRLMTAVNAMDVYIPLLKVWPSFAQWFIGFARFEGDLLELLQPEDYVEAAYITFVAPYSIYYKVKDSCEIVYVEFEKLLAEPEEELGRIFKQFQIDPKFVPDAMKCLKEDSQSNSPLSKDKIGNVKVADNMNEEKRKRYKDFDKLLGLGGVDYWY